MKKHSFWLFGIASMLIFSSLRAQDTPYQTPPKVLADMITAPSSPSVSVGEKGWMLLMERSEMPTIEDLAQPELRIAGLRINPATNGPSRGAYMVGLKLKNLASNVETPVKGLPANPRLGNVQWSPDESKIAMLHTATDHIELWVVDVATATASRVGTFAVNAALGSAIDWLSDSRTLLVKTVLAGRGAAPVEPTVPVGPTTQENLGKKAQAPTYQDLLKNPYDERLFDYYCTSQVVKVTLDGALQPIGQAGIVSNATPSPDGRYVMLRTVHRPYSYIVTAGRFPAKLEILDSNGSLVKELYDAPLVENSPYSPDATITGPRSHNWRADAPATLYWVEAQDGGDFKRKVDVRDKVFVLEAPFNGQPKEIYASKYRFGGIVWGNDQLAWVNENWRTTRKQVSKLINPSQPGTPVELFELSSEDRYNDPGAPELRKNQYGRNVLAIGKDNSVFMFGTGASPEGDRPFVDLLNLSTKQTKRLWRSEAPYFERPISMLDFEKQTVLTSRESPEETPNYFVRLLNPPVPSKKKSKTPAEPVLTQVTNFPHPFPQFKGITKQKLRYKRADGVDLSATLYLPAGYKKEDGPLPTFLWAYPAEFKSKDAAGQVSGSPYQFTRPTTSSMFAAMGYAVLDNASIPIIGEGDKEPNDTYVEQLVASAKAAIDEGVRLGAVDASRVGVGGHSYGAFMTANLLSHSNLFKAGIARSGAYNRTLTPFGFQNEERTYWQAPDVYNKMSPFMNADKMKTPLLLIHGEADNNTGTYPIQSERYYNALKGMGATVRFVLLPHESHGYAAKESVLHTMAEMNGWLEKYVKSTPDKAKGGKVGAGER